MYCAAISGATRYEVGDPFAALLLSDGSVLSPVIAMINPHSLRIHKMHAVSSC
jgi:hypothetical protein